jgi:molybdate transport system substrate-binding protein
MLTIVPDMRRVTPSSILLTGLVLTTVAACGSESPSGTSAPTASGSGTVTVFAASSLTAAYSEIGEAFEGQHPGTRVELSFDASSTLVGQIQAGAPVDVFASADQANTQKLVDAGATAAAPMVFATNSLQIIVEKGNPKHITGVADLGRPDLLYVTCAPEVPIGRYAADVLSKADVTATPVSLEQNVKGIVTKVAAGEADAGIVYRTDVLAAQEHGDGVDIPPDLNVVAEYPLVVTKDAPNPVLANDFVDFVLGEQAQQILDTYGFGAP